MTPQSNDRLLWLCLGVSLFFAVRGIAAELRRVRDLTEIKHIDKDEHMISEGTEDALKLETLLKLSESTSYDLRAASLRIIAERSTKGTTRDLLLEAVASRNRERRDKALTVMSFLVSGQPRMASNFPVLHSYAVSNRFNDTQAYVAVINCLCNFLDEHVEETRAVNSPILPRTRPPGEKKALTILNIILQHNVSAALEAGIVCRWLVNYPFPCAVSEPFRKQDVVSNMKKFWLDDTVMASIFNTLICDRNGAKQLRKYGLMGSMIEEDDNDDDDDDEEDEEEEEDDDDEENAEEDDDHNQDGEDAGEDNGQVPEHRSNGWIADGNTADLQRVTERRTRGGSAAEQAARRRRREAMVISEGGYPLGNENIIQPAPED